MSNQITIHKTDEEGILNIDAMTGQVTTPGEEIPDWAAGLAVANLNERRSYYQRAFGPSVSDKLLSPKVLNCDDLVWIGVDAEGDEVMIHASEELRSQYVTAAYDIDTSPEAFDTPAGVNTATMATIEREMSYESFPSEDTLGDAAHPLGKLEEDKALKAVNE
jgi:hypothetical protein